MNQINNLEKLPATIDPAVAAAMLVPERLNNQSLHAEAVQNAIFQRVRARLVADGKGQPREVIENYRSVLAEDPQLRLRLQIAGWPEILLARPDTARSEADVIDRFLSREFRRIVPDPASFPAGEDLARESVREDPELISEELADIYARQGLYAKAKEIYARLSLLYPEKSVYFAEIIAGLDTKKSGK